MSDLTPLLPEDLIVEIMSWIPVKALIRFSCVSKAWNSLIFDPRFVNLHFQRSPKYTHLLLSYVRCNEISWTEEDEHDLFTPCAITSLLDNPSSTINVNFHQINSKCRVIGTCKGLVCSLSSLENSFDPMKTNKPSEYWFRFYNPATRVLSQESPRLYIKPNVRLDHDPKFGFGYDDSSDTCKVVAMFLNIESRQREVWVHKLGDNCWRKTLTRPAFPVFGVIGGVFVSGTINWIALSSLNSDSYWFNATIIDELVIFSYDLKNETSRYLLKPEGLVEVPPHPPELSVLKGCLCLCYSHMGTHYYIWLMRKFGDDKSWTQLLNLSYEHLQIDTLCRIIPMCMSDNEDIILLKEDCKKFILYNKKYNRMDYTRDFIDKLFVFSHNHYVQSLTLPY